MEFFIEILCWCYMCICIHKYVYNSGTGVYVYVRMYVVPELCMLCVYKNLFRNKTLIRAAETKN